MALGKNQILVCESISKVVHTGNGFFKEVSQRIEYEFNYTSFSEVKSVQARFDINYKMLTLVINICIFNGITLTDDP